VVIKIVYLKKENCVFEMKEGGGGEDQGLLTRKK